MPSARFLLVAGVATARAVVALTLALLCWAAAPAVLGWSPTTVMTASMTPSIDVGDVVVARPVPHEDLVPGRVVLADDPDRPDRLRLHRVAELRPDGALITKGDANPRADSSALRPDAVRGVGVLCVPWVGLPIVWLRSGALVPLALTVALFAACVVLALRRGDDDVADDEDGDAGSPAAGGPVRARSSRRRAPRASVDPMDGARPLTRRALREPAPAVAPIDDAPPLTRRALRVQRRSASPRSRALRTSAVVVAVAALGALVISTPAAAGFHDEAAASALVTAGRVTAPQDLRCEDGLFSSAVLSWTYDGWEPRGFDLLADGRVVVSDIEPGQRSIRIPYGAWPILSTSSVTLRTNVGRTWSAESTASVSIGGALLGFGRPYCR
ncbi:S24/S26 family peptidase [Microbacterium sp. NPDC090007]|uniref:S24/S26 family peptidase n=1 Tax=Microbacterium sp. NPDC090007 TaxID=3364204 RepID=UPI0038119A95